MPFLCLNSVLDRSFPYVDGWMNQAYSRLFTHGHITDCKLLVCMYWTRLVLVRPAASLYSASPLKHHPTGKQWCPNPDHYSHSEPARRSLNSFVLSAKQSRRTSNFNVFCLTRPGIEPLTSRMRTLNHYTTRPRFNLYETASQWLYLVQSIGTINKQVATRSFQIWWIIIIMSILDIQRFVTF